MGTVLFSANCTRGKTAEVRLFIFTENPIVDAKFLQEVDP